MENNEKSNGENKITLNSLLPFVFKSAYHTRICQKINV